MGTQSLGSLVVQLSLDPSTYSARLKEATTDAQTFGAHATRSGTEASKAMDGFGAHTAGARRELLVLAHELSQGNFKRFAGSLMVLGEQMDWMGAIMSGTGAAVAGVLGVLALLGVALYKGSEESSAFNKSLTLTGNAAGMTASGFDALAKSISDVTGAKIGTAREALQSVVSTGQFTGEALRLVGESVVHLHDLTGQKLEEIAKDFARMPEGVAKWADEHNRSMHFMTVAQSDYIRSLEEAGDKQGAMLVALQAVDDHIRGESVHNLGTLEKAWRGVGSAVANAWDWLKSFGREETMAEKVAAAMAEIARIQGAQRGAAGGMNSDIYDQQLSAAQAKLRALNQDALKEQNAAMDSASRAQTQEAGIEASNFLKHLRDEEKGIGRVSEALDQYRQKVAAFNAAQIQAGHPELQLSAKQQGIDEAHIRDQYADKAAQGLDNKIRRNTMDAALQQAKNDLDLITQREKDATAELQALHKATLLSDQAFYNAEATYARDTSNAKIAAYQREIATLQDARGKAPRDEQIKIDKQIGEVEKDIQKAREEMASKTKTLLTEQTDAQRKYLKSITDTEDALLAQAGITEPKAVHAYADKTRADRLQAGSTGDRYGGTLIDQAGDLTAFNARYTDILNRAKSTKTGVDLNQQTGLTGMLDSYREMKAASDDELASLQQLLDQVNKLSWQTTDVGVLQNLDQLRDKIRQSMLDSRSYLQDFATVGKNALEGLFTSIATGTKKPLAAVQAMVVGMLDSFAKMAADKAFQSIFGVLLGVAGTGASAGTAGASYGFTMPSTIQGSGALFGVAAGMFADGGAVTGPGSGTSDSISAKLSNGEYVVKANVVSQPGVRQLLDSLNGGHQTRSRARFAEGGFVGGGVSSAMSSSPVAISLQTQINTGHGQGQAQPGASDAAQKQMALALEKEMTAVVTKHTEPGGIIWRYVNGRS